MLTCPLCKKSLPAPQRECPACRADLSLLVDYVENLSGGLERAEALARAGRLGEAIRAYLEVLEVDPDNAEARRQVGEVATAVRQFDRASFSRWRKELRRRARARRWAAGEREGDGPGGLLWLLLIVTALAVGFFLGRQVERAALSPPARTAEP